MSHDDRPIPATERRLLRARERGFAPVRRTPVALCGIAGVAIGLWLSNPAGGLLALVRDELNAAGRTAGPADMGEVFTSMIGLAWPALLGGMLGALAGALVQTGGVLRWNRRQGSVAGRIAAMGGSSAWGRAVVALAWFVCATAVAGTVLWWRAPELGALPRLGLLQGLTAAWAVAGAALGAAFAMLAALALFETIAAYRSFRARLAMSPTEAREEQRSTDGDPVQRGARNRAARRVRNVLAANRMQDAKGVA